MIHAFRSRAVKKEKKKKENRVVFDRPIAIVVHTYSKNPHREVVIVNKTAPTSQNRKRK